mgnify:CR=1 FL=1
MIVLIDNYDSFSYNVYQLIGSVEPDIKVVRNDEYTVEEIGICLGHQAICEAFGGRVSYAKELMHGKKKTIYTVGESKLFEGLGDSFQAARYHSLAAVRDKLPEILRVTAEAEDGEIMAVEHTEYPIYGVQFHPESVMTLDGKKMVENFINVVRV